MDELATDIQEHWRAAAEFPGYEVSDQGNVRRSELLDPFGRKVYDAVPVAQSLGGSPKWHPCRYMEVSLRVGTQQRRHIKVHHLVAENFLGPRPPGMLALHKNGNNLANEAANLYWGTQTENMLDFWDHRGRNTQCSEGHELTPENMYMPSRKCKICQRKRARERHQRIRNEKKSTSG
jgi:hypothetical protein